MSKSDYYGTEPESRGVWNLNFTEYMHYMYLPIQIRDTFDNIRFSLPSNLSFARELIEDCIQHEREIGNKWTYVYVTARRGFATPGNPLNRPGWHSDGFGTDDINYVWTDRFPTDYAIGDFGEISNDHIESAKMFESLIDQLGTREAVPPDRDWIEIRNYADCELQRLDDRVIHAAPAIPAPGGERSFFKVSFSNEKYNLIGNAHNYGLDYDWEMFDRQAVRNDPAKAGQDRT